MITAPADLTQSTVDAAAALVCAHLNLESLALQRYSESGLCSGSFVQLSRPVVRLLEFTSGDTDLTDDAALSSARMLSFPGQLARARFTAKYESGWASEAELPLAIRQAVIVTAQNLGATVGIAAGVTSVKLPELSVTFGNDGHAAGALPAAAVALLKRYSGLKL